MLVLGVVLDLVAELLAALGDGALEQLEVAEVDAPVVVTLHPSAVLRAPPDARERARREFFADLALVGRHLSGGSR